MLQQFADNLPMVVLIVACGGLEALATMAFTYLFVVRPLGRAVLTGKLSPRRALQQYSFRLRLTLALSYVVSTILFVALLSAFSFGSDVATLLPPLPLPIAIVTGAMYICVWYLTLQIVSLFGSTSAYKAIHTRQVDGVALFIDSIKVLVPRLIIVLALMWAAAILMERNPLLLWIVPVGALAAFYVMVALTPLQLRLLYSAVPLEQTQWAALAPRVRAWAGWAQVAISSINVLALERLGSAQVAMMWVGRPALYLSDSILASTDWRQQDALAGVLIGMVHDRRRRVILTTIRAIVESILLLATLALLTLAYRYPSTQSADPTLTAGVGVCGGAFTYFILTRLIQGYQFPGLFLRADRFAAGLTGDPLAVAVGLNTLNTLRGISPLLRARRIRHLNQLQQQPGHWAPWADLPVPSAIPFISDIGTLTAPLETAPLPVPVPTAPYPEREPVLIAAEASQV